MEEWLEEEEREDRLAVGRPCEAALARRSRRSARLSLSLSLQQVDTSQDDSFNLETR